VADRKDSDREVLTSLPRTRPVRRSAKRGERPSATSATAPKPKARAADGAKARKPAAKPRATAQAKATARSARPAASGGARATGQGSRSAPRRKVPPAGYASPSADGDQDSASADLIGTAVQAAGELAQIGFAVGRQALQSMLERLPKP
jgi:hypothetical protein